MSTRAYIDLRFYFNEETEDDDTYYEISSVTRSDTNISDEAISGITETLAQSDVYHIDVAAAILEAMEGEHVSIT